MDEETLKEIGRIKRAERERLFQELSGRSDKRPPEEFW